MSDTEDREPKHISVVLDEWLDELVRAVGDHYHATYHGTHGDGRPEAAAERVSQARRKIKQAVAKSRKDNE